MLSNTPVIFYVPSNLDSSIFPEDCRDYAYYFLNLLRSKWISWQADENGYIQLKAEFITNVIPKEKWKIIRARLIGKAIIRHSHFYEPGAKSQGYCLSEKYRRAKRIQCQNSKLSRKIRRLKGDTSTDCLPVVRWLQKNLSEVSIDIARARSIIKTMRPESTGKVSVRDYRILISESCATISSGDAQVVCDRFGRIHTPVTSLAKELRCCLSIGGESLLSLDLANSQPLIAGLCALEFHRSRSARSRMLKRKFENGKNPYRFPIFHGNQTQLNTDLKAYLDLCQSGQFYESMMTRGEDRNLFKKKFYEEVFFGRIRPSSLCDRFSKHHPVVAEMLLKMKEKQYQRAAWLMQNFEAIIFIREICGRILNEKPQTTILTIHDSLMMRKSAAPYVAKIVKEEFLKFGLTPTLKWEPEADFA